VVTRAKRVEGDASRPRGLARERETTPTDPEIF
jgi:hypothetical protein